MTPAVRARRIGKRFRRRGRAVDALVDVDLDLVPGRVAVVVGPSQAGKTTLVDVLAGWSTAEGGELTWFGRTEAPPWERLAVVPQAFALLDELNVEENVLLAARVGTTAVELDRLEDVLERIGLASLRRRLAAELSVGERQRVMVARALVGRPDVLLADEPVSAQDQQHAHAVLALLGELAAAGSACLVVTREEGPTQRFGDDRWLLEGGRLRAEPSGSAVASPG